MFRFLLLSTLHQSAVVFVAIQAHAYPKLHRTSGGQTMQNQHSKNGLSGFLSSRLFIFLKFLVTSANIALPINQSSFFVKHLRSWIRPLSVIWHVVICSTHWAKLEPSQFFVINEQRSKILNLKKHIPFLACLSIISIFSCFCFSDSLLPPVSSQEKTPSWGFVFEPNLCSLLVFKLNRGRHSWSAPSNLQTYFMS